MEGGGWNPGGDNKREGLWQCGRKEKLNVTQGQKQQLGWEEIWMEDAGTWSEITKFSLTQTSASVLSLIFLLDSILQSRTEVLHGQDDGSKQTLLVSALFSQQALAAKYFAYYLED